jgi:hypothetical protein
MTQKVARKSIQARTKKASTTANKNSTEKRAKPAKKTSAHASNNTAKPSSQPQADSKKAIVLSLLRREKGATTAEIAKATGWQNHSIRGFISGNVTKRMGLAVESFKSEVGERTYRIPQ